MNFIKGITRIDLGCGTRKHDGCFGIDKAKYEGVDLVLDVGKENLPFEDGSIDYVWASHFLEHLTFEEVVHTMNECWRVLKTGSIFEIVVPHGMSYAGMVDLSHKTFWTEDSFGYFTPENNGAGYEWGAINKWRVVKNDSTPPYEYTTKGWVEVKLREIRALLEKLPASATTSA